jgi:pantothenate synthetase
VYFFTGVKKAIMSVPSSVAIEDLQIFETKEACEAMFGAEMCDQLAQMQIVVNSLKNNIQTLITDYEREVREIDTTLSSRNSGTPFSARSKPSKCDSFLQ